MVLLKSWFDIKHRFVIALLFFLCIASLHALLFPVFKQLGADLDEEYKILKSEKVQRLINDYHYYTQQRWFMEIERNVIFGIVLALGGVLAERQTRTILLTLSFPATRRKWLLVQFGLVIALMLIMNLAATPVLAGAAPLYGQNLRLMESVAGAILLVIATAPYAAATILFTSITNDTVRAGVFSFAFLILTNQLDRFDVFAPWFPETITELLEAAIFPWQAFISIAVVTAISLWIAIRRFEAADY